MLPGVIRPLSQLSVRQANLLYTTFVLICYASLQALLRVFSNGKVESMTVKLAQPVRLIPVHTKGRPPSYFIIAGLVFGQVRPFALQLSSFIACWSRSWLPSKTGHLCARSSQCM